MAFTKLSRFMNTSKTTGKIRLKKRPNTWDAMLIAA
jgi:hypothetical protein